MSHYTKDERGSSVHDRSGRADGGVHFEETIALSDSGYSKLSSLTSGIALVSIVAMVLFVPLSLALFFAVVVVISGNSIVDLVTVTVSGLSLDTLLFSAVFLLPVVGILLLVAVVVVKRGGGGLTSRDEIRTRVTAGGVEIDREGGYLGQSSGVSIPFEAVTAVEYNDPEGDLKINIGDIRAKKFIGGRGADWVRIGRSDGPAVYIGSDRPRALAEVVADLAPDVDGPEPFS